MGINCYTTNNHQLILRNTISSLETGQYEPTAKLAYVLCIALDVKLEELFYFEKA